MQAASALLPVSTRAGEALGHSRPLEHASEPDPAHGILVNTVHVRAFRSGRMYPVLREFGRCPGYCGRLHGAAWDLSSMLRRYVIA